jgi:uncharacterized protein YigE (DUF2233 family)
MKRFEMHALPRAIAALVRRRFLFAAAISVALAAGFAASLVASQSGDSACERRVFEGVAFTVCAYDPRRDDLRLMWRDQEGRAYRGFEALSNATGAERVRFAMNAGMFDHEGSPIGLYVESGRALHMLNTREGPGNFHMMPNGVFLVDRDGRARVMTTEGFTSEDETPVWATQSGPMLVIDGDLHPAFQEDGPSRYVRNGVGVDEIGVAHFVISEAPVSFGRFARFFRNELGCRNALFLDGAVSSLWEPSRGRMDRGFPLGPLVVVSAR